MAKVTFNVGIDMTDIQSFAGDIVTATSTRIAISDGVHLGVYLGTGFRYDLDSVIDGTLTGYQSFTFGQLLGSVSGASVPAETAYAFVMADDFDGLLEFALRGNDKVDGSRYADVLTGFKGNDSVLGGAGSDAIYGGAGNDILKGDAGNDGIAGQAGADVLTGGANADYFTYFSTSDSGKTGATRDRITDFQDRLDRIDLDWIDAGAGTPADDAFSYIGSAAFTAPGQVHALQRGENVLVEMNVNNNLAADSSFFLLNFDVAQLSRLDFIL